MLKKLLIPLFILIGLSFISLAAQPDSVLADPVQVEQKENAVKENKPQSIETPIESKQEDKGISKTAPKITEIISGSKIFWSIIVCLFTYLFIRLIVLILEKFAERSTHYRITLKSIAPFVRIIGWVLAIIIIVQGIFQPPMETIIAVTASVGLAVGFAAQDILKNIFGGIMILFDRPFQVGDKIEVGDYYGEVKEIGLRSTRIVTKDDSLVSLPNAEVVNKAVSNSNSGETNCQVVAEIYLPVDIDTDKVRQLAKEAAQVSRFIYLNKPVVILFVNEVKERRSYLKMRMKAYVSDIRNEFLFQSDMTELIINALLREKLIDKEDLH